MPTYKQSTRRDPGKLKLVEMMETVQGEGLFIGVPSIFVRTGMCNLACPGCDTVWDDWTSTWIEDVAFRVTKFKSNHVVFTGGEPTLWQDDLAALTQAIDLLRKEMVFTLETNGAVPLTNGHLIDRINLWSFSPKVGSLGHEEKFSDDVVLSNIRGTVGHNQIKYVLDPFIEPHVRRVFDFQKRVDEMSGLGGAMDMAVRLGSWEDRQPTRFHRLSDHAGVEIPIAVEDTRIFFQPYDRDCTVNTADRTVPGAPISIRNVPLNEHNYSKDLAALTKIVMERSDCRFRVLPQLHKLLLYR